MAAENYAFIVCSIVGFVITILPLPWQWNASNTGICIYRAWIAAACLIGFIDAIIWNKNIIDWAPAWCALVARFDAGNNVGSSGATLVIVRNLYGIISSKSVDRSKKTERHAVYVDLGIGFGLPVLQMVIEYCIASEDYAILEDVGCTVFIYNSVLSFVLMYCWPIIIGIIAFIYGCLIIQICAKNYATLRASFSAVEASHYFRLMALAVVQMLLIIPISVYSIIFQAKTVQPFLGWGAVHAYFTDASQIPASVWRPNPSMAPGIELSRWTIIFQAIISFAFFGYARDARIKYHHAFSSFMGRRHKTAPLPITGHVSTLPDFFTVSQGSRPGDPQPIVRQITFADSRNVDVYPSTAEPAENDTNAVKVSPHSTSPIPAASDSLVTFPRPAYSPSSPKVD